MRSFSVILLGVVLALMAMFAVSDLIHIDSDCADHNSDDTCFVHCTCHVPAAVAASAKAPLPGRVLQHELSPNAFCKSAGNPSVIFVPPRS